MNLKKLSFPPYRHNEAIPDFLNISEYSYTYLRSMFQSALLAKYSFEFDIFTNRLRPIQNKLSARENKMLSHIKFHTNKSFSDYKAIRRRGLLSGEVTNLNFLARASFTMMEPVVEMIMLKAQALQSIHQHQLERLESHLKFMTNLNDVDSCGNPLSPLNIFNIYLSSIDLEYISVREVQDFIVIIDKIMAAQLADFYTQIEVGLAVIGYDSGDVPIDIYLSSDSVLDNDGNSDADDNLDTPAHSSRKVSSIDELHIQEQHRIKLFQITEEILEELTLDDDMMIFFLGEWQSWLRYLANNIGFESKAVRFALKMMGNLVSFLEKYPEQIPDPEVLKKIENYIVESWKILEINPLLAEKIIERLKTMNSNKLQSTILRYAT